MNTKLTVALLKELSEGLPDSMVVEHWIGAANGTSMRVATHVVSSVVSEGAHVAIVREEGAKRPPAWEEFDEPTNQSHSLTLGELRQAIKALPGPTVVEHWTIVRKHVVHRVALYDKTASLLRVSQRTRFVIYALLNEDTNG
jgi:hypothetical protein